MADSDETNDEPEETQAEIDYPDPVLPGWPLYRMRSGRSGLDYLDTQFEMAHMAGIFLREFFTGSLWRRRIGAPVGISLVVGIALLLAFPGNAAACPVYLLVLIAALVCVIWKKYFGQNEEEDKSDEMDEPGTEESDP